MKLISAHKSPNFTNQEISVEFLVLHYTACDIQRTLDIFLNPEKKVTAHFVIDMNGDCYELGNFFDGPILQGAHAGKSKITINNKEWTSLNSNSIGIELVNFNGNVFEYTQEQYNSLTFLVKHLQKRFPHLQKSENILGHEHIAYERGKADPGVKFAWYQFLNSLGLTESSQHSFFACKSEDLQWLEKQIKSNANPNFQFWSDLSSALEKRISQRYTKLN